MDMPLVTSAMVLAEAEGFGKELLAEIETIWPYFVAGVVIGGVIRTAKLHLKLRRALTRHGTGAIFLATLLGVGSPLCSCGVLAIVISLLAVGLPLAPAMALLVSAPLMSPSGYTLTEWTLGPEWAHAKLVAAVLMGLGAGFVTLAIQRYGFATEQLFRGAVPDPDFHAHPLPHEHLHCNCTERFGNRVARKTKSFLKIFGAKSAELSWTVGKFMLIGVVAGIAIRRWVPTDWMTSLFGDGSATSIGAMVVMATPLYVNQISAAGIVYGLVEQGVAAGPAMAFLVGGPVTAIPAMAALWAMFHRRVFALYLAIALSGSVLMGVLFQYGHQRWPGL